MEIMELETEAIMLIGSGGLTDDDQHGPGITSHKASSFFNPSPGTLPGEEE